MAPSSPLPLSGNQIIDELRQLFDRGEHESLILRVENLQKRKRVDDSRTKRILQAAYAASLIHTSRTSEASTIIDTINDSAHLPVDETGVYDFVQFANPYISWVENKSLSTAAESISKLSGNDARKLEAQVLYRAGRYNDASQQYVDLFNTEKKTYEEKKNPVSTSRWGFGRGRTTTPPVTAAELEQYATSVNELATNAMAALVLNDRPDEALKIAEGLRASYEIEYNAACSLISKNQFKEAEIRLEKAEALIRASLDDDEDDLEEILAPIHVQKAYLRHLAGDVASAEKSYMEIVTERKADAASLAVAANNLTVALGQLAFGKIQEDAYDTSALNGDSKDKKPILPKEQHDALVEGLKKMRATSGKNVERKLTTNQRRAMARNRAILLVQMGRLDACRAEITKLKSEFPNDSLVPLIEASLVAKQSTPEIADKILTHPQSNDVINAARVQLAVNTGDYQRAADLLQSLFPSQPAAIVTASSLLEKTGDMEGSFALLRKLVESSTGQNSLAAQKVLGRALLSNKQYKEAAETFRKVCDADSNDSVAKAQLVVATSFFDANESERIAASLPSLSNQKSDVNAEHLESLSPPKRKNLVGKKTGTKETNGVTDMDEAAARAAAARERKRKKRKKRLPKNYDPNGPPPDPERWLPKTLRSNYKKKKPKGSQPNFRGSQGADVAAAEAAAKNSEKSTNKATGGAETLAQPSNRPRNQRKKKNRR